MLEMTIGTLHNPNNNEEGMTGVSEAELARRRAEWKPNPQRFERGYGALFVQHVTQADKGCDFDFLHQTAATADPEIH